MSVLSLFSLGAVAATSVTFWHMEGVPHRVDRIQTLIDEFNEANPDIEVKQEVQSWGDIYAKAPASVCLLYTSPSPRDVEESRMPSSA